MDNDLSSNMDENSIPVQPAKPPLTRKQIAGKIFRFTAIFILFAWGTFISKQTAGRPYFMGKTFMMTSTVISWFCLYPLENTIGHRNILLKPIRSIRDGLFNIGWKQYPEDDGERSFHWFANYFRNNYILLDYSRWFKDETKALYTDEERIRFLEGINEHLPELATLPMKDPINRKLRYRQFIRAVKLYYMHMGMYLLKTEGVDYFKRDVGKTYMQNLRRHFQLFLTLRNRTRETTPEVYQEYATFKHKYWFVLLIYIRGASAELIFEDYSRGQLDCNGEFVREFLKAREDSLLQVPKDARISIRKKKANNRVIFEAKPETAEGAVFSLLKRECRNFEVQRYPKYPTVSHNSRTVTGGGGK